MYEEYNKKSEEINKFLGEDQDTEENNQEIQETIQKPTRIPFKPRNKYDTRMINIKLHRIELEKLDGLCKKYMMSRSNFITRLIARAKL
jgi:hypothetical protein